MATALSGTGPTYVFLMMEALIDAGVHMGFPRRIAEQIVLQTVSGSVDFARDSGKHMAELRNMVTSPGGTSAEAIYQMEKGGLRTVLSRAVYAAYQRTQVLAGRERQQHQKPITRRKTAVRSTTHRAQPLPVETHPWRSSRTHPGLRGQD